MKRLKLGSVYRTPEFGSDVVLQYIGINRVLGSVARVGRISGQHEEMCQSICTLFIIGFPFRAGIADGYLEFAGQCSIPDDFRGLSFRWPNYRIGTSEIASWSILKDGKQSIRPSLSQEEYNYPLAYVVNIEKLEELIKADWDGKTPILES